MIDAHCHLLPGVDDGAQTIDESMAIARALQKAGVETVFATPHVMKGTYYTEPQGIFSLVSELRQRLVAEDIRLKVYPGAENYPDVNLPEEFRASKLTPLGGSKYLLIEAPSSELPPMFESLLFRVAVAGAIPVLGHPERNPSLSQDLTRLEALYDKGILLQLNARSLVGDFGRRAQACAEKMVKHGIVALLGTDAHVEQDARSYRALRERVRQIGGSDQLDFIEQTEQRLMSAVEKAATTASL